MDSFSPKIPLDEKDQGLCTNKGYFSSWHYSKLRGGGWGEERKAAFVVFTFLSASEWAPICQISAFNTEFLQKPEDIPSILRS